MPQGRDIRKGTYAHYPPLIAPKDGQGNSEGTGISITNQSNPPYLPIVSLDLDDPIQGYTTEVIVYIDPTGSDSTGDGSSGSPWFSPHKALEEARNYNCRAYTVIATYGTYDLTGLHQIKFTDANIPTVRIRSSDLSTVSNRAVFSWTTTTDTSPGCSFNNSGRVDLIAVKLVATTNVGYGIDLVGTELRYSNLQIEGFVRGVNTFNSKVIRTTAHSNTYTSGQSLEIWDTTSYGINLNNNSYGYLYDIYIHDTGASYCLYINTGSYGFTADSTYYNNDTGSACAVNAQSKLYYQDTIFKATAGSVVVAVQYNSDFLGFGTSFIDGVSSTTGASHGLYIDRNSKAYLRDTTIRNCKIIGIHARELSTVRIYNVTFTNCGTPPTSPAITTGNTPIYGNDMGIISQ